MRTKWNFNVKIAKKMWTCNEKKGHFRNQKATLYQYFVDKSVNIVQFCQVGHFNLKPQIWKLNLKNDKHSRPIIDHIIFNIFIWDQIKMANLTKLHKTIFVEIQDNSVERHF